MITYTTTASRDTGASNLTAINSCDYYDENCTSGKCQSCYIISAELCYKTTIETELEKVERLDAHDLLIQRAEFRETWFFIRERQEQQCRLLITLMANIYSARYHRRTLISKSGFLARAGKRRKS